MTPPTASGRRDPAFDADLTLPSLLSAVYSPLVFFRQDSELPLCNEAARSCLTAGSASDDPLERWLETLTEDCRFFLSCRTAGMCSRHELDGQCLRVTWSRMDVSGIQGVLGSIDEISDLRSTQKRLQLLEEAVDKVDEMVLITDRKGVIRYVNETFTERTGFEGEEVIGQKPSILRSGEQDPAVYRELWQKLLSGQTWRGELINRKKNGVPYPEEMTVTPLRRRNGEMSHFIAIKRDISHRKEWEKRLRESRSFLQSIIDTIPLPVFAKDSFGVYTICNRCFEELIERSREEILGRTISAFVSPDCASVHRAQDDEVLTAGRPREYALDLSQFGKECGAEYRIIKAPLLGPYNEIDGVVGVMMNVSDINRLNLIEAESDASKRALRALDRMISIIGHELSSPVAAVKTGCALLERADESERRMLAESIQEEVSRMGSFIEDVVRIGQIYSGSALWNWRSFDLVPLIRHLYEETRRRVKERPEMNVSCELQIDELLMAGDRRSMEQLIGGLLENAIRYTMRGSVLVHLQRQEDFAEITIRDTGPGIPPAVLERQDDPLALSRGLPETEEETEGAGLGLPLCRAILKAHGGSWTIDSGERGTTVRIHLPLVLEAPLVPPIAAGRDL